MIGNNVHFHYFMNGFEFGQREWSKPIHKMEVSQVVKEIFNKISLITKTKQTNKKTRKIEELHMQYSHESGIKMSNEWIWNGKMWELNSRAFKNSCQTCSVIRSRYTSNICMYMYRSTLRYICSHFPLIIFMWTSEERTTAVKRSQVTVNVKLLFLSFL